MEFQDTGSRWQRGTELILHCPSPERERVVLHSSTVRSSWQRIFLPSSHARLVSCVVCESGPRRNGEKGRRPVEVFGRPGRSHLSAKLEPAGVGDSTNEDQSWIELDS